MARTNDIEKRLLKDMQLAKRKFECYEKMYIGLSGDGKKYLQAQSRRYKRKVSEIQKIILPALNDICPTCINCCKLYTPELSIYIAGSIGCFQFIDYVLVRCNNILPNPYFENIKHNLCPFWAEGCILPSDSRSYLCTKYFCDKLKKELDMRVISEHLEVLKSIIKDFSIKKCLDLNPEA